MAKRDNNDESRDRALNVMYARIEAEKKNKKKKEKEEKKRARAEKRAEKKEMRGKRKLDKKTLTAIAVAVLLVATALALFFLIKGDADKKAEAEKDAAFDYLVSDLSEYIYFPSDKSYKDFTVDIAIAKPHKLNEDGTGVSDVKNTILQMLAKDRKLVGDGAAVGDAVVGVGDNVYIWYRGYLVDPETGEEIVISSMSNYGNSSASELGIGTGSFVPGFELGLVGVDTTQYARFVKITTGKPDPAKHIAYVDFTRRPADSVSTSDKQTQKTVRIDLSDTETIEETFGKGFLSAITAADIGSSLSFTATIDGVDYKYSETKVNFVTTCEKKETNGGKEILTVECYFPYDYGTTGTTSANLRNETAYFEVYIELVQDWTADEWTEEFLREYLAETKGLLTPEEIEEKYEGEGLLDKFELYVWDVLMEDYEEERDSKIEEAVWQYYQKSAKVAKYPKAKVNAIYDEYVADVYAQFEATGGGLTNASGEYEVFSDIDSFARAYLSLSSSQNWQSYLKSMSESLVKERLVLYYILRAENLVPTASEFKERYDALRKEYLDEYIAQYVEAEEIKREDYTDAKWDEFLLEREKELFDYYDDEYFTETVYYELLIEVAEKWPKVTDVENGAYEYPSEKESAK